MDKSEIISRISLLRTRANLSARALSIKIGMNEGYINRLESAKDFVPKIDALLAIIEACGSSTEEFFYYDITQYAKDKELLTLLSITPENKKNAIIELLKSR